MPRKIAWRTSLIYLLFGILWIIFSDWFLDTTGLVASDSINWQTFKGIAFVGVTGVLLYWVLQRQLEHLGREARERRRAEQEILELNEALERRVADRTAELDARNRELETFTYSVSHDLKAPLRGIDGYSRLLFDDCREELGEEGRKYVENIRRGARQMNQLIDDLLAYSRIERKPMTFARLNPRQLVAAIIEEREHDLKGAKLMIEVGEEEVAADPEGLATALRNLVDNAVKFSARRTPPMIEIRSRTENDRWILSVRDNGTGFDMKFHDRIFQIFHRLHRAEDFDGTGIGLAIVQKVMERMGGRVRAESEPERGAVFYLDLPRTSEKTGSQQKLEHPSSGR